MPVKVGIITVSLPPELSTVPPEAIQIADALSERAEERLRSRGLDVLRIVSQAQSEEASVKATQELVNKDVDCIIYMVGSWIYVPIVVTPARRLNRPFILWALPDMVLSSLVPSCVTHGSLDEMGIQHKFVYGWPEDDAALDQITKYARASMVVNHMDGIKYGLIGGRCMYMYTAMPDLIQIKRIFGVETEHIDQYTLVLDAQKVSDEKALEYLRAFKTQYGNIEPCDEVMIKSIKLYFALKGIIEERNLSFVGVKCLPELATNYVSGCLAVSHINNDGIVAACEADTNAALTMQILHLLSGEPVDFADVFQVNLQDREVRLVNCGALATNLAVSKKDVSWGLQYEFIGPARGATTVFVCKPGRITLARLARIKGEYVMQVTTGEAYSQPKEKMREARDRWPHLFFRLDGNAMEFVQNCRSNHQHWIYGDFKDELVEVCNLLGIRAITI